VSARHRGELDRRLQALQTARHPHLVEYVAAAWRGGGDRGGGGGATLCLLMELCDGGRCLAGRE
jgi:hypothetical protein